jgi:hypothetical protein
LISYLKEKHGLRVFKSRGLRRIFGLKRDDMTGGWRKLHNNEHHNLFSLPSNSMTKSMRIRWVELAAQMGEKRKVCMLLVGKPEGKRPLGIPKCVVYTIKVILERENEGVLTGLIFLRIGTSRKLL